MEGAVDPAVLLPVVLLVVAEFSTLARDLDLTAAVREGRPPLAVDFLVHGTLTYPRVLGSVGQSLLRLTVGPVRSTVSQGWKPPVLDRSTPIRRRVEGAVATGQVVLFPNLGQFGVIHLTNTGLLVVTYSAASRTGPGGGLPFVEYLLAIVVTLLPLLEVSEYEHVQRHVDPVYSFTVHLGVNVGFLLFVALRRQAVPPAVYAGWWFLAGYLFLVTLALDIRRMEDNE